MKPVTNHHCRCFNMSCGACFSSTSKLIFFFDINLRLNSSSWRPVLKCFLPEFLDNLIQIMPDWPACPIFHQLKIKFVRSCYFCQLTLLQMPSWHFVLNISHLRTDLVLHCFSISGTCLLSSNSGLQSHFSVGCYRYYPGSCCSVCISLTWYNTI